MLFAKLSETKIIATSKHCFLGRRSKNNIQSYREFDSSSFPRCTYSVDFLFLFQSQDEVPVSLFVTGSRSKRTGSGPVLWLLPLLSPYQRTWQRRP